MDDTQTPLVQGQLGVAQPPQPQQQPQVSVPNKEVGIPSGESVPLVELKEEEKIPEEVQGWVEKLQNEEVGLPEPVVVDGKTVVREPVTFKEDKIVLPLTQQGYARDLKLKVSESARWLAEWCTRLIKMMAGRTKFRDSTE